MNNGQKHRSDHDGGQQSAGQSLGSQSSRQRQADSDRSRISVFTAPGTNQPNGAWKCYSRASEEAECQMFTGFNLSKRFSLRESMMMVSGLLFSSCIIQINGISLSNDFKHLPESCKERIVEANMPLDSLRYDDNVYLITTDVLLSHIEQEEFSLIYIWTPYCKSDACCSPQMFEEYCQAHGYRPYIILDQYTEWQLYYNGKSRLLMFDPKQWDTNSCQEYIDKIDIALTGSIPKVNNYASYHLYSKGQHIKSMRYLE